MPRSRGPITPTLIAALRAVKKGKRLHGAQWPAWRRALRCGLGQQAKRISDLESLVLGMQRTLKADLTINANGPKPEEPPASLRVSVKIGPMEIEMEGTGEAMQMVSLFALDARELGLPSILDNMKADQHREQTKLEHAIRPKDRT